MKRTLISNPPYNMKWQPPVFAQLQPRFVDYEIPPKSNANFAFILSGIEKNDRCVFCFHALYYREEQRKKRKYAAR